MDIKKFEELVKKIDKNKYHINRSIRFDINNVPYIDDWNIYRKDMTTEEYFDSKNLAILSSRKGNTLEDIEKFIKENCR